MASPPLIYATVADILGDAMDALDAVLPAPYRYDVATVVNGPPSFDGVTECAERVHAWAELLLPTDAFPAPPAAPSYPSKTTPPGGGLTVVVQTLRCEPTIDDAGYLPAPEELDLAARLVAVDAQVVWNALECWALDPANPDALMVSGQPVPPQGGLAGWETRLLVELEACGPCTWPEVPFPDGFLPGT